MFGRDIGLEDGGEFCGLPQKMEAGPAKAIKLKKKIMRHKKSAEQDTTRLGQMGPGMHSTSTHKHADITQNPLTSYVPLTQDLV